MKKATYEYTNAAKAFIKDCVYGGYCSYAWIAKEYLNSLEEKERQKQVFTSEDFEAAYRFEEERHSKLSARYRFHDYMGSRSTKNCETNRGCGRY